MNTRPAAARAAPAWAASQRRPNSQRSASAMPRGLAIAPIPTL